MADFGAPSDNENAIRSRRKKISVFPVPMSTILPISKVQLQKKFLPARPNEMEVPLWSSQIVLDSTEQAKLIKVLGEFGLDYYVERLFRTKPRRYTDELAKAVRSRQRELLRAVLEHGAEEDL